jgi:hypothetical protein
VWRGDDDRPLYGVTHWMPQPPPLGEKP